MYVRKVYRLLLSDGNVMFLGERGRAREREKQAHAHTHTHTHTHTHHITCGEVVGLLDKRLNPTVPIEKGLQMTDTVLENNNIKL